MTLDAYSTNEWASKNQLMIYEAQSNTDDGVTDLPSSVKTFIGKFYSSFKTRYENETFKNILFAETYLDIKFANDADGLKAAAYSNFIRVQKDQFDSYEDYSAESISFLADWWNIVLPQTNNQ